MLLRFISARRSEASPSERYLLLTISRGVSITRGCWNSLLSIDLTKDKSVFFSLFLSRKKIDCSTKGVDFATVKILPGIFAGCLERIASVDFSFSAVCISKCSRYRRRMGAKRFCLITDFYDRKHEFIKSNYERVPAGPRRLLGTRVYGLSGFYLITVYATVTQNCKWSR